MIRYKLRWNDLREWYDVYDTQHSYNPSLLPEVKGHITQEALSAILSKLILHSQTTNQTLSDSFLQLADEVTADFQDYVAIMTGHKQTELQSISKELKEFSQTFAQTMMEGRESFEQLLLQIERAKDSLPKAIHTRTKVE